MEDFTDDTCFLFAEPSFLTGLASVMDIGGSLLTYNLSRSGKEADERAIASDWAVVGSEILNAAKTLGKEEAETKATK
jgi:hypothetical protein